LAHAAAANPAIAAYMQQHMQRMGAGTQQQQQQQRF
jgi:hypothetical protein